MRSEIITNRGGGIDGIEILICVVTDSLTGFDIELLNDILEG